MTALIATTDRERKVADALRTAVVREIERRGVEATAQALDVGTAGVEALLWRKQWPLTTAFRLADALDLPVTRIFDDALMTDDR